MLLGEVEEERKDVDMVGNEEMGILRSGGVEVGEVIGEDKMEVDN